MNEKQELFIREYLKDFNGTRAYKVAYESKDDKVAATGAWRMLRNVDIQQAIQEQANKQLEEVDIDVNYIVRNIKEVTERCMQKEPVMYFDKINKEWVQEEENVYNEDGELIKKEGVWKFDATNSLKGLELLGKYKAIFKDKIEVSKGTDETIKEVDEYLCKKKQT